MYKFDIVSVMKTQPSSEIVTKSPESFSRMMKKYGPGFVAYSKKSGRVVAHAKDMKQLWDQIKNRRSFRNDLLVISHVPEYGTRSVY